MNFSLVIALLCTSSSTAFISTCGNYNNKILTHRSMFSGGGGVLEDEDPEQMKMLEANAKAMGMTVAEYQLGISARKRLESDIDGLRFSGGDDDIGVEVDARSNPKHLVIKISEAGKAKGKEAISNELIAAFEKVAVGARGGRQKAQADMMQYIQEQAR
mmetsp:Transcript_18249/g.21066  ORF Transcript_18249/g.21066 Transcript_18249/m.21066 type:complete len:159 (-) Transcript_18249:81-557(-)|eukprot:CAMPEP_0194146830 /NCGR_PEP_ID=MMETSP0152-20130528/21963_1 /TAXON_ID=1049557 /ORGANISM="Thalassiothrix antarctica, Strain L6-D1" /LENGTH=158 /DNA_ID=CAMNT_0038847461 /DNA_START=33 /DNA_END=509 /DNA_ORIENTATION=+